ncbi:hypothetical protein RN001_003957 [Aquatica leii]|uniref:Sas10 C-terminal domain-containing protein n=1 Tax=Aquatica leii TaxID=1421715 RepID=A0AAN7SED7_9COLE|nr:hypothetical protein RN001_003957 [Aquatica leii]
MSSKHTRFDDDIEYEPTDSETEYTQEENNDGDDHESDDEVAVYGVGADSSSDDDSDIALSDVEGQANDDDLPDVRAWGKDRRNYYSTDYVDPDYGGYQGTDAIRADLEEEEARNLQKQLMNEMDEDDFAFDFLEKDTKVEDKQPEEVIKTDISKLSKRQKLDLLHKESPEFFGLVDDFKKKMTILRDYVFPTLTLWKKNKVKYSNAIQFIRTYQEVISNYCTNINMYLLLKASRVNVQNHPVIKRLFQYRKLLSQLDPVFENVMRRQVEKLLEHNKTENEAPRKKVLKVLRNSNKEVTKQSKAKPETREASPIVEEKVEEPTEVDDDIEEEEDGDSRRAITYQIAKNKGLTPHRNKLQRNPRVKHRNKYRKALIRRKGAVRTVRTELSRYGGELSGIKATVSKSIKIKS